MHGARAALREFGFASRSAWRDAPKWQVVAHEGVVEVARLDRNPTRRAPMPVVAVVVLVMVEGLLAALAMFTCNTVCPHEAVVDDRAIPCT